MNILTKVEVPEGNSGEWRIERFTVTESEARFDAIRSGYRSVRAGEYTRLMRGATVVMSDTPAEMRDHIEAVRRANGFILINGLGLGMVLNACLRKPEVSLAVVVENSPDVISMVGPFYQDKFGSRLVIANADAMTYSPPKIPDGAKYGMVWHDIWDYLSEDNLPEMKRLHRRYGRVAEWQGSWGREQISRLSRR